MFRASSGLSLRIASSLALTLAVAVAAQAGCSSADTASGGGGSASTTSGAGGASATTTSSGHAHATTTATSTHASSSASTSSSGGGGSGGGGEGGCVGALAPDASGTPPALLSKNGLYSDIASLTVASYTLAYEPSYKLWSDGANKSRWAYIPDCAQIDNTDEDHWSFPVGTRFWKEFSDPNTGKKLETRMIEHYAPGDQSWLFVAYAWRDTQDEADLLTDFMVHYDVLGTTHDIPSEQQCTQCHLPLPEHILGFGAIQLSGTGPVTLATLSAANMLKVPHPAPFVVPGDATAQAALGYLHANCGHCHNDDMFPVVGGSGLWLRLRTTDMAVTDTWAYTTGVNQPTTRYMGTADHSITTRILPGDPNDSCVTFRMSQRSATPDTNSQDQMPPLATEVVDATGLAAVEAWITALPAP